MASGDPGSGLGRMKLNSSSPVPPSGGRSVTISEREFGMPMTVSTNSPSMNILPSTSRPSPTKKAVAASRSATVMPTWSKRGRRDTGASSCISPAVQPPVAAAWLDSKRPGAPDSQQYASRTVTIGPSRFNLWVVPILAVALAGAFLWLDYQMLARQGLGDPWLVGVAGAAMIAFLAAVLIFVAIWGRKAYIRVDGSTITFGPSLTSSAARRNTFNRHEVARIRATHSPLTRITLFLRSDGSTLSSTPGLFWGRDGLQRLADYL